MASCLRFGATLKYCLEPHEYYRKSGELPPPTPNEHRDLLHQLHRMEIQCALMLWIGAQRSDLLREAIGLAIPIMDMVQCLHSLSSYAATHQHAATTTTATTTTAEEIVNSSSSTTLHGIFGLCRLLSFSMLDERRIEPVLKKGRSQHTADMIHTVLSLVMRHALFLRADSSVLDDDMDLENDDLGRKGKEKELNFLTKVNEKNQKKEREQSMRFITIVSTMSTLLGRILRFTPMQEYFCSSSGTTSLAPSTWTNVTLNMRMTIIFQVMGKILHERVKREQPMKYVRVVERERLKHDATCTAAEKVASSGAKEQQQQGKNVREGRRPRAESEGWMALRTSIDNREKRLHVLNQTVVHRINNHAEEREKEQQRRSQGVWRHGDAYLEEDAAMNRCLVSLFSVVHEWSLENGVSSAMVHMMGGAVLRLCVETLTTPSLRPDSRAVRSAAGVIFNLFRRRETRNILLSSTSTTSHVIVDMLSTIIDCVLRDTIRDDNMEIHDDQEVLPCYPPITSSLLLMSLRHCAWIGMIKRDEMFERRGCDGGGAMNERKPKGKVKEEGGEEEMDETNNQDDNVELPKEMMPVLRRVTPALLLLLKSASTLRENYLVELTENESKMIMTRSKMMSEALDLLRCLGPLHPLQLKRSRALSSVYNDESDRIGLRSQRTINQLRVMKMEDVEAKRSGRRSERRSGTTSGMQQQQQQQQQQQHRAAAAVMMDTHAEMKARLVLLNNEEKEATRWTKDDLIEDRKTRDHAAMASAEFFVEDDYLDNDHDADDDTTDESSSKEEVAIDSILWVRAAHEHMAYESLLLEHGGSINDFERAMHMTEHRRKRAASGVETMVVTSSNTRQVRFGDTYITVNDKDKNPYHSLITTESASTKGEEDSVTTCIALEDDDSENEVSISSDDDTEEEEEKNPYLYFQRMEEDAVEKRDGVREALLEWKEEIALDPLASVDPVARQEKMRELAKSMLEEGLI